MKSFREALSEVRSLETHPLVKKARKAHKQGVWDGNVDKNGNPIVHINGRPHTVVVEGYRELESMFGLREKEWRALVKKYRRQLEKFQRTGQLDKKIEDELITWAMDNGEVQSKDDIDDFMDIVLNAHYEPEGEELSEMSHRFVFDKVAKLDKAEKLAQKFGLKTDSETQSNYYYLSVDDGGNTNNFVKWLKATDSLHESIEELEENYAQDLDLAQKNVARLAKKETGQNRKDYEAVARALNQGNLGAVKKVIKSISTQEIQADLLNILVGYNDLIAKMYPKAVDSKGRLKTPMNVDKMIKEETIEEASFSRPGKGERIVGDSKFEIMKYPSGLYSINFVNVRDGDIFIGKEDLMRFKAFMSKVKV